MALWVDDDFTAVADLSAMDAEVVDVAQTESIVLDGPGGVIRRSKVMAQQILGRFMSFANFAPNDLTFQNVNMPITTAQFRYNYAGFAQLVVSGEDATNWSALKSWVAAKTLLEFYRMASNKNADRYSDRHDGLRKQIREEIWPNLKRRGLPIHFNPLVAPGAIMERVGVFGANNLSLVNGAGTSVSAIDFAITWTGTKYISPTVKNNQESYRSARLNLSLLAGKVAQVSIVGLTPPNGNQPEFTKSSCRYSPGVAAGWNVWAGDPTDPNAIMYRQNTAGPIPLATTSWTLPGNPVFTGEQLDLGQFEQIVLEISTQIKLC